MMSRDLLGVDSGVLKSSKLKRLVMLFCLLGYLSTKTASIGLFFSLSFFWVGWGGVTAIGVSIDRESTTLFNICCFVPNIWRELFGLGTSEAKIVCACVNIHLLQKFN